MAEDTEREEDTYDYRRKMKDTEREENPDEQENAIDPEALISAVEIHDVIYNKRNLSHEQITSVDAAWQEVAHAVGSSKYFIDFIWF